MRCVTFVKPQWSLPRLMKIDRLHYRARVTQMFGSRQQGSMMIRPRIYPHISPKYLGISGDMMGIPLCEDLTLLAAAEHGFV